MSSWAFWLCLHQKLYSNISVTYYLQNAVCTYTARRFWSNSLKWELVFLNICGWGKKNHVLWLTRANPRNVMLLNRTNHRHSWLVRAMGYTLVCQEFVKCKSLIARAKLRTATKAQISFRNPVPLYFTHDWSNFARNRKLHGLYSNILWKAVLSRRMKSRRQNLREWVPLRICLLMREKLSLICWDWIAETDGNMGLSGGQALRNKVQDWPVPN